MNLSSAAPQVPQTVAFLGLGVMGFPMAGHLAKAGHAVTVYNRSAAKAQAWTAAFGGRSAPTPEAAVRQADVVFCCVGGDEDLRSVTLSEAGAFAGMKPAAVFVDHTTVSAQVVRELASVAAARGLAFMDAPVSGGEMGAQKGQLMVMCGGDAATFERVQPVIQAYAKAVVRLGDVGSGQLAKMVNQICVAGLMQGLAEGLAFGVQAGLDMPQVLAAISQGAAQSWQMQNRGATMMSDRFDFGFAIDWLRKDLALVLDEGPTQWGTPARYSLG